MNSYEQKQEARRERLERAAGHAREEADGRFDRAMSEIDGIPPGQPILVGHHSERRHRRALEKHDGHMRKAIEAQDRAKELAMRAAAVGTGGVSSDDPDAVDKLREKLAQLEAEREHMKAVNLAYRKRDDAQLLALTRTSLERWEGVLAGQHSWQRQPHPAYELSNLGARIRDTAARVARLEALGVRRDQAPVTETYASGAVTVIQNFDENRVQLRFRERLSKPDYSLVRRDGFVWSKTNDAFQRQITTRALYLARQWGLRFGALDVAEVNGV